MIRRLVLLVRLFISLFLLLGASPPNGAAAQAPVTWSEPFNISDSATSSIHPAVVTDSYGHVHVFWCEELGGREIAEDELPDAPNTIMYRRWDGEAWTAALDILVVAGDPLADFVAAAVDDDNQLHLVWTGLSSIYYSTASAVEAHSVRAWSMPKLVAPDSARTAYEADVAVDVDGRVHIAYATGGNQPGVYHVAERADSPGWTLPVRISDRLRTNETAYMHVRFLIDAADRLHAVWGTSNPNGYNQAVYYARKGGDRATWGAPILLADAEINTGFTGFPNLLAYGQDELVLIHVDQGNRGRIERTSRDGGRTWTEPRFILSRMEGVNGFLIPLVDGGGGLHLVINMRPSSNQRVGIYYAPRAGPSWSPITPVAVDEPFGPSAHYTDAGVRLGNEIHAVWTQLRGGEVWHVRGVISDLEPLSAQEVTEVPKATPVATLAEPTAAVAPSTATEVPMVSSTSTVPAWMPFVAATVPVALLLAGVAVWQTRKR